MAQQKLLSYIYEEKSIKTLHDEENCYFSWVFDRSNKNEEQQPTGILTHIPTRVPLTSFASPKTRERARFFCFKAHHKSWNTCTRARTLHTHSHTLYFWGLLWVFFFVRALQGGLKTSVVKNLSFSFGRSLCCRCWGCSIVVQNTGPLKYPHLKGEKWEMCVWESERERELWRGDFMVLFVAPISPSLEPQRYLVLLLLEYFI